MLLMLVRRSFSRLGVSTRIEMPPTLREPFRNDRRYKSLCPRSGDGTWNPESSCLTQQVSAADTHERPVFPRQSNSELAIKIMNPKSTASVSFGIRLCETEATTWIYKFTVHNATQQKHASHHCPSHFGRGSTIRRSICSAQTRSTTESLRLVTSHHIYTSHHVITHTKLNVTVSQDE